MKQLAWPVPIARLATFMPDQWNSQQEAEDRMLARPFYKFWEPRVKERLRKHALRPLPTPIYPEPNTGKYTLKTLKHIEAYSVARKNFSSVGVNGEVVGEHKLAFPDIHPQDQGKAPFYRPECRTAFLLQPNLRPACVFIFGSKSPISTDEHKRDLLGETGTGYLGSGGVKLGRVAAKTISAGHSPPMENVNGVADTMSKWIANEMQRSADEEECIERHWEGKTGFSRQRLDEKWLSVMKDYKEGTNIGRVNKL